MVVCYKTKHNSSLSIGVFNLFPGRLTQPSRSKYTIRPRSPLSSLPASDVPGVSIIRPLKGLDPNLYENLESSFLQEYSNYEIIFSVHDKNDQALRVVNELVQKYPAVPVQIVSSE